MTGSKTIEEHAIELVGGNTILDLAMEVDANDAGAATIREYLVALARVVWDEGEGFSGKRPFGNSSWEYELYTPLAKAGLITVSWDDDGYIDDFPDEERRKAQDLIQKAIEALGERQPLGEAIALTADQFIRLRVVEALSASFRVVDDLVDSAAPIATWISTGARQGPAAAVDGGDD